MSKARSRQAKRSDVATPAKAKARDAAPSQDDSGVHDVIPPSIAAVTDVPATVEVTQVQAAPVQATPVQAAVPEPVVVKAEAPRASGATSAAVAAAVGRARGAQGAWSRLRFDDRLAALEKAAKNMLLRRRDAMALVREEMGKGDIEGLFNEALGPLDAVKAWAPIVRAATAKKAVRLSPLAFPKKQASVELLPRGVVAVIAPWNFPIAGLYRSLFPALLAGNGVVVKPSEYTPRSTAWIVAELARELPEGLVGVVQGDGQVGAMLVDADVDAVVFTGSTATGAKVRVQCAERGIPSSIEMGGKDGALVLPDCDLPRSVAGITQWALNNAGQACGAIEVAYVDMRVADAFAERVTAAWQRLRTEPGGPGEVDVAPLGNERQLAIVEAHVKDAVAKGARVLCGGKRVGNGLSYAPTILDRCTAAMDVVKDETFGPVLAIVRIDGADDGVRQINASRYGLGASIWTQDVGRAERLAERLEVGIVTVNNHAFTGAVPALPWTGTRATGFGIANSEHSLATFTRPKAVVIDRASGPDVFWLPFDASLLELGELLADAQLGKVLKAWKLPFLMRKRIGQVKKFFGDT